MTTEQERAMWVLCFFLAITAVSAEDWWEA